MSQAILQIPAAPSGLDMRVQINQIFLAIITSHSGPSAPNPTYPGMWWGDTTAGRLRRRNNSNSAWIDIGPLDDVLGDLRSQITALNSAVASAVPTGAVFQWDLPTAPTGYLLQNGAAVSRTTYAALFALYGTTFGAGDGSTTFNLPDKRGMFIRGHDAGRGVDPGRVLGSFQDQMLASHGHGVNDPGHSHAISDPSHYHSTAVPTKPNNAGAGPYAMLDGRDGITGYQSLTSTGAYTGIGIYGSPTNISIQAAGGFETRPKNIAVNFIVKT